MNRSRRVASFLLACVLLLVLLAGCSGYYETNALPTTPPVETVDPTPVEESSGDNTLIPASPSPDNENPGIQPTPAVTAEPTVAPDDGVEEKAREEEERRKEEEQQRQEEEERRKQEEERQRLEEEKRRAEQLNSFSMMYYLAITAEEIRTSRNNRLILDDIYTSLINDINPGAIDEITQDHLKNLRDIIKSYLMISTKRERLQFIYNQEKAAAIRNAVPNPLAILSVTNALNWKKLAFSVAYTAVSTFKNYKDASSSADMNFLMSSWDLDDEEVATVQKNRDRAFDYMVDMVQKYGLDGLLTLNEKAIGKYAEICSIESIPERIKRLETEENTYRLLGNYWLELANCYFETNKYEKCLECIEKYNELATGIYRMDFNYAKILPSAIVAAQQVYIDDQYILNVRSYADQLMENTTTEDWSSRYFVAQVYLDLYTRSKKSEYLEKAYQIALENVTVLLGKQRELNRTYLEDVKELTVDEPDYRYLTEPEKKEKKDWYNQEKKRVNAYNKELKEARKTELPTLYEPLVLNCELLFALAEEIGISDDEKAEIEAILQTNTAGIFLTKPINDAWSFSLRDRKYAFDFNKDDIVIPAELLTAGSTIIITVFEGDQSTTFEDCVVTKVDRKGDSVGSFIAHIASKELKKYKWTVDSMVTVKIIYGDAYDKSLTFNFEVSKFQHRWMIGDVVEFVQK